jgi:hypothetical protein
MQEKPARVSRAKAEPAETGVKVLQMISKRWASGVFVRPGRAKGASAEVN